MLERVGRRRRRGAAPPWAHRGRGVVTTRHDPAVYERYYLEQLAGLSPSGADAAASQDPGTAGPSRSSATASSVGGSPGRRSPTAGRCARCRVGEADARRPEPGHELLVGDARARRLSSRAARRAPTTWSSPPAPPSRPSPTSTRCTRSRPTWARCWPPWRRCAAPRCPAITLLSSGGTVYGPDAPTPTPETAPLWPISTYGVLKVARRALRRRCYARQHGAGRRHPPLSPTSTGPGEPTHGSQGLIGVTRAALRGEPPGGRLRRRLGPSRLRARRRRGRAVVVALARPAGRRPRAQRRLRPLGLGARGDRGGRRARSATQAVLEHRPGRPTDVPAVELDVSCAPRGSSTSSRASLAAGLWPTARCDISRVHRVPGWNRFHFGVAVCRLRPGRQRPGQRSSGGGHGVDGRT